MGPFSPRGREKEGGTSFFLSHEVGEKGPIRVFANGK